MTESSSYSQSMKSAVLFVFFCVCVRAQPGSVEGTAVNAASGQPMAGVHVRLMTGGAMSITEVYGALTNASGHFSMARVTAGTYIITAERTGFVYTRKSPAAGPATTLSVKPGELADLKLELAPRAVRDGPASIVGIVQSMREQDSRTMRAYDQLRACAVELRLDQLDAKLMRQRVDLQVVRRLHAEFVEEPTSLAPSNCEI